MPKFSDLLKGNQFPGKNTELKTGMVIRAFVKDTKPPKIKRFVIVGITEDKLLIGTVFLNSELNINALSAEQQKSQYKLIHNENRPYLDWDSFVDCSDLRERDYAEINDIVQNNQDAVIGILNEKDLMNITFNIISADTVPKKMKKKYSLI